jgi:uncharacterized membrane protein
MDIRLLVSVCAARRDERGTVAIIAALSLVAVIGFAALAVDVGAIFLQSRKLQGMADLAALSAARDLANASRAAEATVTANDWGEPLQVKVTTGRYAPDRDLAATARFSESGAPNAAKVEIHGKAKLYFGQVITGRSTFDIVRRATAARADLASFSIGTRLASLQGGVVNQVLGGLTGSTVSLTVMDYNALVGAKVDLLSYAKALRTSLDLEAATFDDTLAADITTGQALRVIADQLTHDGHIDAGAAIRKIATAAGTSTPVDLSRVLSLGPYGAQDRVSEGRGTEIQIDAMDLANAILTAGAGGRQVKLDLGANVPGLADVDVWLAIGERPNHSPWLAVDHDGDVIVRTAQMRLYVEAKALGALGVLGLQPVKLPILVEAASGEAKVSAIDCPATAANQGVTLAVRPSLGQAVIGEIDTSKLNDFKHELTAKRATILDLALIKATGSARAQLGGDAWKPVRFSRADITAGAVKSVATDDLVQATVASLLGRLDLKVNVLGLGLNAGVLTGALSNALAAMTPALDSLLNGLTDLLGVRLGEADVSVSGLRCRDAALVA